MLLLLRPAPWARRSSLKFFKRHFASTLQRPEDRATELGKPRRSVAFDKSDPLRILFCGSDEFSCEALRVLHRAQVSEQPKNFVRSIDVVVRPGKLTGRGLKKITHVPLKHVADKLGLPIHEIDTFTGWEPPGHVNLVIAMSFGLFVPPRILRMAKYGGINVHPSFLPEFVSQFHRIGNLLTCMGGRRSLRGPAPLQHTLLRGDSHFGITVQTLHEAKFDHGTVLAQTQRPGIQIEPDCTLEDLYRIATSEGARMLEGSLLDGLHVPPHVDVGWRPTAEETLQLHHAPKLGSADREVDWANWTAQDAARRLRALGHGSLWFNAVEKAHGVKTRVILEDAEAIPTPDGLNPTELEYMVCAGPGASSEETDVRWMEEKDGSAVIIPMEKGDCLRVQRAKVAGNVSRPASRSLRQVSRYYGRRELKRQ